MLNNKEIIIGEIYGNWKVIDDLGKLKNSCHYYLRVLDMISKGE